MGRDGRFLKGLAVFLGTRDYPTPEPSPLGIYDYGCAHLLRTSDGMVLIRVTGEIDVSTAPQLAAAVHHALAEDASSVYVDLAQVLFFGAAGATVLLRAKRACQRGGTNFVLLRPSRSAMRVLRFTDLIRPVLDLKHTAPAL
ncbi:MAG TPA: STAS domain-containing protein [Acidimicrobiales bacterium]|nr:STAS domain-containing protein [Acidimicrobiales bacterium]